MNANLQKIATHLAANPDLAALQPWQIAEQLNAPDPENLVRGHTEVSSARGLLLASGDWAKIVLTAENAAVDVSLRAACITVRDTLSPPMSLVHTGNPETLAVIEACLDGLVTAGVVGDAVRDALLALSWVSKSWAETNLGGPVSARDIVLAKEGDA